MKGLSVAAALLSFAIVGCGRSPLLNHKDEEQPRKAGVQSSESANACLLRFGRMSPPVCSRLTWELGPVVGENRLRIDFSSEFGAVENISFWADMPAMGHGTAPVTLASFNASSVIVSDLWLVMPGRWVLHLKLGDEDRTIEVNL